VKRLLCQLDPVTCDDESADDTRPLSTGERDGFSAFDRQVAFSLYSDLIAPVEGALAGAKRVYTARVGKIGSLPLSLLPTAAPAPGSDDADPDQLIATPWLADRYAFVMLPSVSALRFADQAQAAASGRFVGYGAPRLGGGEANASRALRGTNGALYRGARGTSVADQAVLARLSPLPATEGELVSMATALGGGRELLRLAGSATEGALKADRALSSARVIAFATHGLLPRELDGYDEPGLVFTPPRKPDQSDDGVLSASEAAQLKINADWVILSACNTAAGDNDVEGLSGLARAFLFAGARSLLASHWRVSDTATAQLTVETLMADKTMTRAEALQTAMRAIRSGKRADGTPLPGWERGWAHPSAWAPFSLIANTDR
jgi:CHAT domain-containing protein